MSRSQAKMEEKKHRESRLRQAIADDDVDELHNLIEEERQLLDRLSKHPFPDSPLHIAAAAGKTDVAIEIAILKPSFARKLNPKGYSPMHLALEYEHYDIARALITINPNLIRVQGHRGITPLHHVAGKEGDNELELLVEFLCACNSSIKDLTSRRETVVHVAVKNHNPKALKVLLGWLRRTYLTEILYWKDKDGKTALGIAEDERQPEIIKLLGQGGDTEGSQIIRQWITKMLPEHAGRAARPPTRDPSLSQLVSREPTFLERLKILFVPRDESTRNLILLVATFVATATYQSALTPPGGYWQDDYDSSNSTIVTANSTVATAAKPHQAGKIILTGSKLCQFTALNSLTFMVSILTIWINAVPLLPRTVSVYLLMILLSSAYITITENGFPKSGADCATLMLVLNWLLLFLGIAEGIYIWLSIVIFRRRVNATGRAVCNFPEW